MKTRRNREIDIARYEMAMKLRAKGKTFREIGIEIGKLKDPSKPISRSHARMMVKMCEILKANSK